MEKKGSDGLGISATSKNPQPKTFIVGAGCGEGDVEYLKKRIREVEKKITGERARLRLKIEY